MEYKMVERKRYPLTAAPVSRREVRRQLLLASGGLGGESRDPVSSVTENFHQTFDAIGQRRARALTEGGGEADGKQDKARAVRPDKASSVLSGEQETESTPGREGSAFQGGRRVMPGSGIPLKRFSETAFRRGTLSASVLGGTGKMMLVSCLKHFTGTSDGSSLEDGLLYTGSQTRNVPGHSSDKMIFSRGFANQAVGLVVDTLRDARQTVESLLEMAHGTGEVRGGVESGALQRMYPFLDSSRERTMVAQYESRLAVCTDVQERAVLQNGLVHVRAMLDRKASMKEEFINKLRQISEKAEEALEEFETPGFVEEVWQEVQGEELPDGGGLPPDGSEGEPPDGSEAEPPDGSEAEPPDGSEAEPPDGSEDTPPDGSEDTPPDGSEAEPPDGGEASDRGA